MSAPRRGDLEAHRFAAHDGRRKILERDRREERSAPRAHRFENGEHAVVVARRDEGERAERDDGRAGGLQRAAARRAAFDRRQARVRRRESLAHRRGGVATERARAGHFDRAAQRAGAQRVLAFDRGGDALACGAARELARRPPEHGDIGADDEQPDEERHGARKRHPARRAERRGAEREHEAGGADGERHSGGEIQAPESRAFTIY